MKKLILVIICFLGLTTFHQAVSRDAPVKETTEFGAMHTNDSVGDTVAPAIIVNPAYIGGIQKLFNDVSPLSILFTRDSIRCVSAIIHYESDSLGVLTIQKVRVKTPRNNRAAHDMVLKVFDSLRYNWYPATINGQPVEWKDSIPFHIHFQG